MAKSAVKPSAHSDYFRSPRPGGKAETISEVGPGVALIIHICRPMPREKHRGPKPRPDEGHG